MSSRFFSSRWRSYTFLFSIWSPIRGPWRRSLSCLFFTSIIIMAFFRISFFDISFRSFSSWFNSLLGLSIVYQTYIGNNLPKQLLNSLSSWKQLIPDDIFTFTTASLQILIQRLNFCWTSAISKGNFSPSLLHPYFNFSINLS